MSRFARKAALWLVTGLASLSAHAAVGVWLLSADAAPQVEGDEPATEPVEVAFLAPEAPEPEPVPEPVVEPIPDPVPEPAPEPTPAPELAPEPAPAPVPVPEPIPEPVVQPAAEPPPPPAPPVALPDPAPLAQALPEPPPDPLPEVDAQLAPLTSTPPPKRPKAQDAPKTQAKAKPQVVQPPASAAPVTLKGNREWASRIRTRIERQKRYPAAAGGAGGSVTLRIAVAGSGALAGLSVAASSGTPALDAAALQAVQRAAPFPAAPTAAERFDFQLTMTFTRQ